ncbi:MAG: antibiotic biosynthesis monooxygenase [Chloroflexi bacterium]|nr:antibiotic biosynthesis monooxygenase [Chloroflexota bacterium]
MSKEKLMYAMTGKLTTQTGKRNELIDILKRAANLVGQLPACRLYIVSEDIANENHVWIFEMWDDKEAHDSSLKDERVRALISEAMPLMDGAPDGVELRVAGGHGIGN